MVLANWIDRMIAVVFIGFAALLFMQTLTFPAAVSHNEVGPAYYPNILSAVIVLICLTLLITSLTRKESSSQEDCPSFSVPKKVWFGIGLSIIYGISLLFVNYFLATFLTFILCMRYLKVKRWGVILANALGFCLFTYLLFFKLLNLVFPSVM